MKALIASAFAFVTFVGVVFTQGTFVYRADVQNGAERRDTYAAIAGQWQVWIHGANTKNPSYELGKSWILKKGKTGSLSFIGYSVWQPAHGGLYIEPMIVCSLKLPAKMVLDGNIAAYIPIEQDGKLSIFTNRIALTAPVGELRIGPAVTFMKEEDKVCRFRTGILVKYQHYEARLMPSHSGAPPSARLQANIPFAF